MTDLNALIERLERVRNQLTPGVIEAADLDGMALSVGDGIKALRTLAERQPVGDVVCYLYQHPNEPDDFGTQNLMPADIAAGWTETPLYTADQAAEQRGEDRGLAEAIRQRIGGK